MDFLDTVADGVDNAVRAVLAPVADTAGAAASALRGDLTRTWHGVFGSPTAPGGTNWNAYSHEELYAMVHTGADPGQVGAQSAVLDGLGRGALDTADELAARRRQVADHWQGTASGAHGSTLAEHSAGGAAVAEHAAQLSAAVQRAAEALSRAQAAMPHPVDVAAATANGAMTGGAAAGPGFALGAVTGAGASWFGAALLAANRKAEAVEVMQAFEQSLRAADPPQAPAKVPPPVGGDVPLPAPRPEAVVTAAPAAAVPRVRSGTAGRATTSASAGPAPAAAEVPQPGTSPGGATQAGSAQPGSTQPGSTQPGSAQAGSTQPGLTQSSSTQAGSTQPGSVQHGSVQHGSVQAGSVQAGSVRSAAARAGAGPSGAGSSVPAPATASQAASDVTPREGRARRARTGEPEPPAPVTRDRGRAAGWSSGPDGRAAGGPVAWRDLVGRGGVPGVLTDAEPRAVRAAPGAAAAHRRTEDDRDHHNRMPRGEALFTLDDRTPPPVIGA